MKWIRRGSALAVLLIGWVFILVANNFHITPPVVFLGLGFLAAVAAVYTLFRTGATAVGPDSDEPESAWDKPAGAYTELEREKRALLKAIKEAEFDHQMGKLSKADADAMIGVYRARAIEVIKELDVLDSASGKAGTVRDRILREARARLEVETKATESARKRAAEDKASKKAKRRADAGGDAVDAAKETQGEGKKAADAADAAKPADAAQADAAQADAAQAEPGEAKAVDAAQVDAAQATPPAEAASRDGAATPAATTPDAPAEAKPAANPDAVAHAGATDESQPGSKEAVS